MPEFGTGREGAFEIRLKIRIIPEYCVPYALHLFVFRRETPSVGAMVARAVELNDGGEEENDEDNQDE